MEVPVVAKQATAEKRQRRERGSINPDDIISGAFELAEQVSIDNLSMPLLGKHLGVGVTSIYWYFRKKDDLLNAMTDRALSKYVFATPYVEASDWRETLRNHARLMRKTFMGNPILCDLILIRAALSPKAARLGAQEMEKAIANLVEAGLSPEDAFDTYSAISVHVRGSVVLHRLYEKNQSSDDGPRAIEDAVCHRPENHSAARSGEPDRAPHRGARRNQFRVRPRLHPRPRQPVDRRGIKAAKSRPSRPRKASQVTAPRGTDQGDRRPVDRLARAPKPSYHASGSGTWKCSSRSRNASLVPCCARVLTKLNSSGPNCRLVP